MDGPSPFLSGLSALALTLGLAMACAGTERIQDPLELDAVPIRSEIDIADAATHQLELQAAAEEVQTRLYELHASSGWRERGYFNGAEHDAIEWLLFRFVSIHQTLWHEVDRVGGIELLRTPESRHPRAHLLVLHAGLTLADSSTFLVTEFSGDPVAVAKLNEAFYRSQIAEGTYDELRLAVTGEGRLQAVEEAWALHERAERGSDRSNAVDADRDSALAGIAASLPRLYERVQQRLRAIGKGRDRVVTELEHTTGAAVARSSDKDLAELGYEVRALVFKDVSRIKSPTAHLIRFSSAQKRDLVERLRSGDVILTYTAGYASDVFIPGAFKHGITYVGGERDRAAAGLTVESVPRPSRDRADLFAEKLAQSRLPDGSRADLIEAVAEGVKFSNFDRILDTHVNRLLVLRPQIDDAERTAFLAGVFAFLGDPYDFRFDFADASRQVCTEVIYRALNGKGGIDFTLTPRAGHPTLSADDIVLYHLAASGRFEVVALAEEDPEGSDHAARVWTGEAASQRLKRRMAEAFDGEHPGPHRPDTR